MIAFGVTTQRLKNTDLILVNNNLTLRKNQNMCLVSGFQSESSLSKPVSEGTVLYVGRSTDRLILRDKKKCKKYFKYYLYLYLIKIINRPFVKLLKKKKKDLNFNRFL